MADFVGQCLPFVIVQPGASGNRRVEDNNTIIQRIVNILVWEGGIPKQTLARSGLKPDTIDIECGRVTLVKKKLHHGLLKAQGCSPAEPCRLKGVGRHREVERDTCQAGDHKSVEALKERTIEMVIHRLVMLIHGVNTGLDLPVWKVSAFESIVRLDHVPHYWNRPSNQIGNNI